MKNMLLKLKPAHLVIAILGVVALAGVAKAGSTFSWANAEQWAGKYLADKVSAPVVVQDEVLGAVTGPELPNPNFTNGLAVYVASGVFADNTTTLASIRSPFLRATSTGDTTSVVIYRDDGGQAYTSATSTVDLARLEITSPATTTYAVSCGASASPGALPSITLASTSASLISGQTGVVENNITAAQGALADSGTVSKIMLSPGRPYVVCKALGADNSAFIDTPNTFDGKYTIRFSKTR